MRVYGLWHGGASYAPPEVERDVEEFSSLRAAKAALQSRADFDPFYPCVDDGTCEMQVFRADPRGSRDPYPDLVLTLGPRGGVRVESA